MKKLRLLTWLLCFLAGTAGMFAQEQYKLQGEVTDQEGEPLIGASVVVKHAKTGVATDLDGKFEMQVKSNDVLVVSYVGFVAKDVAVNGQRNIKVVLDVDNTNLDELVVVGYGVQKKSDMTGAVASVGKDRLSKLPVTNVLQAMQGATAGVNITQGSSIPGEAPTTVVRGRNSINANSGPYVVVDGINGANGVILVTTKHGSDGHPRITYSGYIGVEDFSHKLKFANGSEIIQRYKDYVAQNPGETMYNENVKYANEVDNFNAGRETDWVYDIASRTGVIQNHTVGIQGGSNTAKYYVSLDYLDQKGVLKGYNYKRYSIRTNLDVDVTNWLKVGTSSYIASHNRDGGRIRFLDAEAMSPWGKVYNDDGTPCIYPMYSEQL